VENALYRTGERTYTIGMGTRGPKPKLLIDTSWRPELAYAVGLIASDGCLSPDGRHIDLTSKDVSQLQTFKRILGIEHIVIGKKKGGYGNTLCYHVQFGSVVFYEWLMSIGLSSRKSHTIGALLVPDEFFADFLRGIFDGDGCIYSYMDKRWKHSYMVYIDIASASHPFLLWMQNTAERLYGVQGVIKGKSVRRVYLLSYAKEASFILLNYMYAQDHAPRLTRKFTKVQNIRIMDMTVKQ